MSGLDRGAGVSDILPWMQAHVAQLQTGGLIVTGILLILALILLNRVASELHRSRSQRLKSEQTFERLSTLLAARGGDGAFDELRGSRRVSLSGPVQKSSRKVAAKSEPKPTPRAEPKPPTPSIRMNWRKSLH